ncbi:unnamed protein product [Rangifer tarandus platyrhynchus]|uniref:Uncharacterized protein n=1 Tax=Rangifer tarandus platyrhynchus TaxID=3082113 RepID=A0ABN8ZKT0_RANTA|nr:unnamed protein product [Rangifer tarandus platyrhynchus]
MPPEAAFVAMVARHVPGAAGEHPQDTLTTPPAPRQAGSREEPGSRVTCRGRGGPGAAGVRAVPAGQAGSAPGRAGRSGPEPRRGAVAVAVAVAAAAAAGAAPRPRHVVRGGQPSCYKHKQRGAAAAGAPAPPPPPPPPPGPPRVAYAPGLEPRAARPPRFPASQPGASRLSSVRSLQPRQRGDGRRGKRLAASRLPTPWTGGRSGGISELMGTVEAHQSSPRPSQ